MTAAEKALGRRVAALEEKVDGIKEVLDQILALAEADPYSASFRRYQERADAAMGGH